MLRTLLSREFAKKWAMTYLKIMLVPIAFVVLFMPLWYYSYSVLGMGIAEFLAAEDPPVPIEYWLLTIGWVGFLLAGFVAAQQMNE